MISSKQESYVVSKNVMGDNISIYVNPSDSDFNELIKFMKIYCKNKSISMYDKTDPSIRFVAIFKTKKVFVTSGIHCIHNDILRILKITDTQENNPEILCGTIRPRKNGRPKAAVINNNSNISKHDWSWLDNYFDFNIKTIKVFKGFKW